MGNLKGYNLRGTSLDPLRVFGFGLLGVGSWALGILGLGVSGLLGLGVGCSESSSLLTCRLWCFSGPMASGFYSLGCSFQVSLQGGIRFFEHIQNLGKSSTYNPLQHPHTNTCG